jgi:hypothetical protein
MKSGACDGLEHMAHMGKKRNIYKVLVGKPHRDHLEDLGKDWRITSK